MHLAPGGVDPVKTPPCHSVHPGHVIAIVGKFLARREARRLANDPLALDHELAPIRMLHHPLAAQQGYGLLGLVPDRDEVDERVRLVRRQARPAMVVAEAIQMGGEAFKLA